MAQLCLPVTEETGSHTDFPSSSLNNGNKKTAVVTLEKRLFHALHAQKINTPTIKEFQECWAFANSIRSYFLKKQKTKSRSTSKIDVVIDVAGGHGALAALCLLLIPDLKRAVVIDPAIVEAGKRGIRQAWFGGETRKLEYRHETLFTALPSELHQLIYNENVKKTNVLVVACHACQHLTDATLRISENFGVNVAVMPCCQKDLGGSWKAAAKNIGITNIKQSNGNGNKGNDREEGGHVGIVMDLLSAGKMMGENAGIRAGVRYEVKMKVIDPKITPQNRLIMCKTTLRDDDDESNYFNSNNLEVGNASITIFDEKLRSADLKLQRAYQRAHDLKRSMKNRTQNENKRSSTPRSKSSLICMRSSVLGFGLGLLVSMLLVCKRSR